MQPLRSGHERQIGLRKPASVVNKIEQLERRLDVLEFIAIAEALGLAATGLLESVRAELPATVAI